MALKDGDVVRFDYTLHVDGKVHDTSDKDVAEKHKIRGGSGRYGPLTVTIGTGQLIPGLESHIRTHASAGQLLAFDVAAADGFGERDPHKVQTIPLGKFRATEVSPYVGLRINVGHQQGIVTQVASGRVRVDTNHELAGKKLHYECTIRDVIMEEAAKVEAVLDGVFGAGKAQVEITSDEVVVLVPKHVQFDGGWINRKYRLASRLRAVTGKAKAIKLVEGFYDDFGLMPGHEGHRHGPEGHGNEDGTHHHDHGHDQGGHRRHRGHHA